jgi:Dual-action HEIGH metallo-peptidase
MFLTIISNQNFKKMKKVLFSCGLIAFASLTMISCKKGSDAEAKVDPLAADRAAVRALSFDASDLQKVDGGYIVEGDIFLSNEDVKNGPDMTGVPAEEQWRTFNLVSVPGASRNITIRLASSLNTTFWNTVLQNAVNRYNALGSGFRLTFTKVATTSSANITVNATSGSGGSAGFPSGGNPYATIFMGTSIANCGTNTATTVLAHEMGHCIGFRHTDWFNRSYSCGTGGSEGQQTTGVGAVLIPGTPSTVVAGSWMLACYSCGGNRPFVSSDVTALLNLY